MRKIIVYFTLLSSRFAAAVRLVREGPEKDEWHDDELHPSDGEMSGVADELGENFDHEWDDSHFEEELPVGESENMQPQVAETDSGNEAEVTEVPTTDDAQSESEAENGPETETSVESSAENDIASAEEDMGNLDDPIPEDFNRVGCYQFRTVFDETTKEPIGINERDFGQDSLPGSSQRAYSGPAIDAMTTEDCFGYCSELKKDNPEFMYFALYKEWNHHGAKKHVDKCRCLNMPPVQNVSEEYCGQPCAANKEQMCGGVCKDIIDHDEFCDRGKGKPEYQTFAGVWSIFSCPNKAQEQQFEQDRIKKQEDIVQSSFKPLENKICNNSEDALLMGDGTKILKADVVEAEKCKRACYEKGECTGFWIDHESLNCGFFSDCDVVDAPQNYGPTTYYKRLLEEERNEWLAEKAADAEAAKEAAASAEFDRTMGKLL